MNYPVNPAASAEMMAVETERHVLALRETLVRHDENLKAHQLMQSVPYIVANRPAIVKARDDQFEMVRHAIEPQAYTDYYETNAHERPFEEQYAPVTIENAHDYFTRLAFLRDQLRPGSYVLDLSANDGWMAANLAMAGHVVDCVDLNPDCVHRARDRANALRYKVPGRINEVWHGNAIAGEFFDGDAPFPGDYDAVVFFETIEHVPDPLRAMQVCAAYVKDDGNLYVSTPIGAVEAGGIPTWDHVEPKGHIHAFLPHDLEAMANNVGTLDVLNIGDDRVMTARIRFDDR